MGTLDLAAAAAKTSSSSSDSLLIIIVIFAIMMIFLFRSQSRRRKQTMDIQKQANVGSRIRTTFGVYGTIVDSDDRNVIVEIAPGVRVKMVKQAVMAVVPDDEPDGVTPSYSAADAEQNSDKPDDDRSDLTI